MTLANASDRLPARERRASRTMRCAVAATAVWIFSTADARAEPSASDRSVAVTLFRDGKDLAARGNTTEACAKFIQSHRLDPKLGSLLHVATCHEIQGRTTSAWLAYTEAAALATRAKQDDRAKLAREKVRALEPLLAKVIVTATGVVPGQEVKLDGTLVGEGTLGAAVPVDPGEHQVTATAPSRKMWSTTVTVARGPSTVTVSVPPLLADEPPPPSPVSSDPQAAEPNGDRVEADVSSAAPRTIGWVLIATSAVAAGVGTGFGLRAASQSSDANAVCPGRTCPTAEGVKMHDDAKVSALLSTVAFGVGIAAAGTGLYLLLSSKSSSPVSNTGGLRIAPLFGPNGGGVDASVRF